MTTKSIWEGTAAPAKSYPSLQGERDCDVAVIGAGITGLTAAMLLSEAGMKVCVLEAHQVGLGTSGNSTGNLYVTVDEHLSQLRKKWNDETINGVVASRRAAIDLIASTIRKYGIDCNFVSTSFNYFAETTDKEAHAFIEQEYDALKVCGLDPVISERPAFPFHVERMLSVNGQAQFHPLNYCRALAEEISAKCQIYEHSAVIETDAKKGLVKTENGSLKAKHIVMATHVPKGVFGVHAMLGPYREFGVAAPLQSDFPDGIFWGLEQPKHSIRKFNAESGAYIMVIGDKFKTGQHSDSEAYITRLKNYLSPRVSTGNFDYVWGGQQYRPADGLPYIGKHEDNLYYMTGFATDGLTYGTLAAMIVSDLIQEKKNEWEDLYHTGRFTPVKSAKQVLKENVDVAAQYLKDAPWNVDAKAIEDVKNGEGKVLEHKGEKLAVYRSESGEVHAHSAVCTHMKCVVNWNASEKSWDCPCHGSRFRHNGEVIEGPAISALKKVNIQNDNT